jgi:glycosyltransferase
MKNVFIIDDHGSSRINGIGTYIRELTYCLKQVGANVNIVACNYDTDKFAITFKEDVKNILFPKMQGNCFQHYNTITTLLKIYVNDTPDNLFIVNHSPCELFLKSLKKSFPESKIAFVIHDLGWTWKLLGDSAKLKEILSMPVTNDFKNKYKGLIDYYHEEQRMYEIADRVIVLAKETESILKNVYGVDGQKILFAPNGLRDSYSKLDIENVERKKTKLHLNCAEKVILYTGRVNQIKGCFQILNAFEKVLEQYSNCRLVIVGTLLEAVKTLKHSSKIASKVIFTGQITAEQVKEWYQVADIGLLPSFYEQCSYTGIEMMMHGLPIVASDGFCVRDMFKDDINARIAKIEDVNNLDRFETNIASAILEILHSPALHNRLGVSARKIYESTYAIHFMQKIYEELLLGLSQPFQLKKVS